jgi:hypothetical protein
MADLIDRWRHRELQTPIERRSMTLRGLTGGPRSVEFAVPIAQAWVENAWDAD